MKFATRMFRTLPLVAMLLSRAVAGEQAPATATASIRPMDPEKIAAMDQWRLRREMENVEGRFFTLYNQLSSRNEFDVVCTRIVQPNSKMKYRSCRPRFLVKASNAEAEAFLDGVLFSGANIGSASEDQSISPESLQSGGAGAGQRSGNALLPQTEAAARLDEYRQYMLGIINASPDLLILVRDREALEAALRKQQR